MSSSIPVRPAAASTVATDPQPMAVLPSAEMTVFDAAPVFSNVNGQVSLTLTARRFIPDNKGGVREQEVVVGFLRCSEQAAGSLRNAIESALLLARPVRNGPSN